MSKKNYFVIDCNDRIEFQLENATNAIVHAQITSTTDKSILVKIKSNEKKRYIVKPSSFLLKPEETRDVEFTIKNSNVDVILNESKKAGAPLPLKDKFQILGLPVSPVFLDHYESEEDDRKQEVIDRHWKTAQDRDIFIHYLSVVFNYPENFFQFENEKPVNEEAVPLVPKDVAAISEKYSQLLQDYNICKEELEKYQQNNNQLVAEKDELVHKIEELNAQKEEMEKIKKEEPAKVAVQQPNAFNMISIVVLLIAVVLAYVLGRKSH